ncbi:MAG: hypothetical protein E7575_05770 [Ruminococcaceae bacterium]|nr:hypothetical protein [Oscillospiraceae bacterium]
MEEKKKQEFEASTDFEIEESNAMKVLKGKNEDQINQHESHIETRKIGKLENFWYQHKWHAGLIIAAVIIVSVLLFQIITHVEPDVTIMYTGPQAMVGRDYERLEKAFKAVMGDYNKDKKLEITFADTTYIPKRIIEANKKLDPSYTYDAAENNNAYQRFWNSIAAGTYLFCMLDPELHDEIVACDGFVPLSEIFGEDIPESAYGEYGIYLGETEFYKSNPAIQYIPQNTVLAVRVTNAIDLNSEKEKKALLKAHKAFLKAIVEYEAPKEDK